MHGEHMLTMGEPSQPTGPRTFQGPFTLIQFYQNGWEDTPVSDDCQLEVGQLMDCIHSNQCY